jgi:hypothetical protein
VWGSVVFVHGFGEPVRGNGDNAAPDEMAVSYYLSNEGTGPAFNVEHGVEIEGTPHTWQDHHRLRRFGRSHRSAAANWQSVAFGPIRWLKKEPTRWAA